MLYTCYELSNLQRQFLFQPGNFFLLNACFYMTPIVPWIILGHMEHLTVEITIDIEDPAPPFAQLVTQIKNAILKNKLKPGDALPSIRQLAGDLELNHKTVAKAYRFLERDSVIQTKGYRGTFIHPDAKANSTIDLAEWTTNKLSDTIARLREAGVTDSEIRIAFGNLMNNRNS